jgi:hypothetical protein
MSVEEVNRALDFVGMGLGYRPAPLSPSAPLFDGAHSQGTLSGSVFGGGVNVVNVEGRKVAQALPGATLHTGPKKESDGIQPVCAKVG